MTINLELSDVGIRSAISRLMETKENLRFGIRQLVEILCNDGADIARSANRSMASIGVRKPTETTGVIVSSGEAAVIAEFGAGNATISPTGLFEQMPSVPVYPGSYSETVGTGQYAMMGKWEFPPRSNHWLTEVPPRQGLYEAKQFIISNYEKTATGVINL